MQGFTSQEDYMLHESLMDSVTIEDLLRVHMLYFSAFLRPEERLIVCVCDPNRAATFIKGFREEAGVELRKYEP